MIFFTHVPKTSGTSFRRALVEPNVAPDEIYTYRGLRPFLLERGARRPFVWGHVPLGAHVFTRREVRYITFLRDPLERAVSHYYFVKDSDPALYKHPARDDADACSLTEFFALRRYQNLQARFVAGLPYHYLYPHLDSPRFERATLRAGARNLFGRYACYGLQERFPESLEIFQHRLGWTARKEPRREKKTGSRPAVADLDATTIAALEQANHLDRRLYELASERFERQLPGS